jgi:hypothetical protein
MRGTCCFSVVSSKIFVTVDPGFGLQNKHLRDGSGSLNQLLQNDDRGAFLLVATPNLHRNYTGAETRIQYACNCSNYRRVQSPVQVRGEDSARRRPPIGDDHGVENTARPILQKLRLPRISSTNRVLMNGGTISDSYRSLVRPVFRFAPIVAARVGVGVCAR